MTRHNLIVRSRCCVPTQPPPPSVAGYSIGTAQRACRRTPNRQVSSPCSISQFQDNARYHPRGIFLLRRTVLRRHDIKRSQNSSNIRPYTPASKGTAGTQPGPKSKCLVWEGRYVWGEPTFRVEPIGLCEDARIVQHSPGRHNSSQMIHIRGSLRAHTTHLVSLTNLQE